MNAWAILAALFIFTTIMWLLTSEWLEKAERKNAKLQAGRKIEMDLVDEKLRQLRIEKRRQEEILHILSGNDERIEYVPQTPEAKELLETIQALAKKALEGK